MGKYTPVAIYTCDNCQQEIEPPMQGDITTGYGIDSTGNKHCFPCCAEFDKAYMIAHGAITLYLCRGIDSNYYGNQDLQDWARLTNAHIYPQMVRYVWSVTNWPNSLSFPVYSGAPKQGKHNIARNRYDVWFVGPDNHIWHGVQYGDMTEICHCKRTKQIVTAPGAP